MKEEREEEREGGVEVIEIAKTRISDDDECRDEDIHGD